MGKWRKSSIEEIATVNMGQSPDSNFVNEVEYGTPFLQGNAEFGTRKPTEVFWCSYPRKIAQKEDILVSVRAPVGEVNIADKEYCIGRGLAAVNFWGLNKLFASYAFSSVIPQLHIKSQGTTFLAVSKGDIDKAIISYPISVAEQSKIAEILITVDDAIDKTRALIEKYKNIKKGMMQDLLDSVDLQENRVKLSTYAQLLNGDRGINYPTATDIVPEGSAFINAGHLECGKVNWHVCDYITHKKYMSLRGGKIQKGDIIYCLRGTLGKNAFVDEDTEGTIASSLVIIRPQGINHRFLFYQLNSFVEEKQRLASDNGTAQPNLSAKSVGDYWILLPSPEIQLQITEQLSAVDQKIQTERNYLAKLQDIKQGLIQDLLTNTVSVDALL